VFETRFGYHIIKLISVEKTYAELDEVREEIKNNLTSARERAAAKEILANTDVEYLSEKYPARD
jgi:parvulin-like peptidyl-prolyl isomerase